MRIVSEVLNLTALTTRWMIVCFVSLFVLGGLAHGQTTTPCACGAPTPVSSYLPTQWIGIGSGYNPAGSPKFNGWASYATLVSPTQQAYSYSSYDVVRSGKTVTASARTGVALVVRQYTYKKLHLFLLGLGTAGVATTNNAITGSFTGGGLGVVKFGQASYTFEAGARVQKSGSVDVKVYEIGFGRTF